MYGGPNDAIRFNTQRMGQKEGPENRFVTRDNMLGRVEIIPMITNNKHAIAASRRNVPAVMFSYPKGPEVRIMKGSASNVGRGGFVPLPFGGLLGRSE